MKKTALVVAALSLVALPAVAGPVTVAGAFGSFTVQARSINEMRWDQVVPQQYDYSCGAAAVATLLTYHYGRETTEAEVFEYMISVGDREQIETEGFSMLDMKNYLDSRGLDSDGFKVDLDDYLSIGAPSITLINTGGYKHFVVIKGMDEDRVLIGDPAVGSVIVPKEHFESLWEGTVLGARAEMAVAKQNFNHERDWAIRPTSPIDQGRRRADIGTAMLLMPGPNELGK
ncbi:MAG: C39 family peptidase [Pseudomonadota bacterium]